MRPWKVGDRAAAGEMRKIGWLTMALAVVALFVGGVAVFATEYEELKEELAPRFRAIDLSDGVLFEPLPEFDDLPVVEISDRELWIDGAPATRRALRRLGELGPVLRELAQEHGVEISDAAAVAADASAVESTELPESPESPESPEPPSVERRERVVHKDDQVVVGGNLTVEAHEIARDVVVLGGQLTILGRVDGEAVVVGGSADIQGEVNGDVAVIGGAVEIGPEAEVRGNVESVGGSVNVQESALVEGEINEVSFGPGLRIGRWIEEYAKGATDGHGARAEGDIDIYSHRDSYRSSHGGGSQIGGWIVRFMLFALFGCLALLFLPGPIGRIADQARVEPAKSGLVGLVAQILAVPLLLVTVVVLLVSVIGIPLLVLLPVLIVALAIVAFLGFLSVALQIGRFLRGRFDLGVESLFVLLILGLFAIQGWSLVGSIFGAIGGFLGFFAVMFMIFGALATYSAATVGLGAALITRAGTLEGTPTPLFSSGLGEVVDAEYSPVEPDSDDGQDDDGQDWVERAASWDDDELDTGPSSTDVETDTETSSGTPSDEPPREPED